MLAASTINMTILTCFHTAQFCPTCGNMLLLEAASEMRYYCQSCPYIQNVTEVISIETKLAKEKEVSLS